MIELILDKKFVNIFHLAINGEDEYVEDFINFFIKNLKRPKLISNYIDSEDLMHQAQNIPFLRLIIQRNPELYFSKDLEYEINSKDFPVIGSPFKLILTGEKTDICNFRRKRFGLEYINPSNLSERWKLHYSRRPDINRKTTDDEGIPSEQRFDSWEKFKTFCHPLNSIILIDKYFLKWKTEKCFKNDLKNNILPLFESLLSQASNETIIEILIVSNFEEKTEPVQKDKVLLSLSTLKTKIEKLTNKKFKLNIIAYKYDTAVKAKRVHDRIIITNYFYIESGAGFNIFNEIGIRQNIEINTEIKFRSILNIQNVFSAFYDLKQLNLYINKQKNAEERINYLNFYPEKTNRLLNIEYL